MKRGDIMRLFLTLFTVLIVSSCADNSMSQRDMNLKVVNTFWDNILTENYQVAPVSYTHLTLPTIRTV